MTANNPSTKRQKGKDFERDIAKDLRESGLDKKARRMPCSGALEDLKADIICPELPIHIEAKRQEKWNVDDYYQQALSGKKQHEIPIVVMKKNRKEAMALLSWRDLIHIMQMAKETGFFVGEYGFTKRKQLGK
jgi:Holliday junction resolvase